MKISNFFSHLLVNLFIIKFRRISNCGYTKIKCLFLIFLFIVSAIHAGEVNEFTLHTSLTSTAYNFEVSVSTHSFTSWVLENSTFHYEFAQAPGGLSSAEFNGLETHYFVNGTEFDLIGTSIFENMVYDLKQYLFVIPNLIKSEISDEYTIEGDVATKTIDDGGVHITYTYIADIGCLIGYNNTMVVGDEVCMIVFTSLDEYSIIMPVHNENSENNLVDFIFHDGNQAFLDFSFGFALLPMIILPLSFKLLRRFKVSRN